MGSQVETLADLFPPNPRVVCVGINPAPVSVTAGHYYQGQLGQLFFSRLAKAGLFAASGAGFEDDEAVAAGIGFTDIVKRPTGRADEVSDAEMRHGRDLLGGKLAELGDPVMVFSFKKAAVALVGRFDGNGWLSREFAGCRIFVMPGPYENRETATATIGTLLSGLR